jgi:phosphocarrier protein HPr
MSDNPKLLSKTIIIPNKLGLHARASAKLVKTANRFRSTIQLMNDKNKTANAKSIMGVMMLGASKGTSLTINTQGLDEKDALNAIIELIENKFDEEE